MRFVTSPVDQFCCTGAGITKYECSTDATLPSPSAAFTVKLCGPVVDVSIAAPFATGPVHEAIPEPSSLQE